MSNINIDQVLNQMRVLANNNVLPETTAPAKESFSSVLKDSVDKVNSYQKEAADLKTAYALGDSDVDIPEVMVAIQKASISFEAVTEVRNQLLSAYQEVMNMQV